MSAKIRFIARLVLHDTVFNNFDAMTAEEVVDQEERVEALIGGDDLGYMGHYVTIACAASAAWDAAIKFAASEVEK